VRTFQAGFLISKLGASIAVRRFSAFQLMRRLPILTPKSQYRSDGRNDRSPMKLT